ncbi:MAG: hypothetical protein EOO08_09405 [Chitinophagaceae bacterium]|nr:MAG: hypothetical protein EOO08_09405 [Chitinophagaceae bacterium]
MKTVLLLFFIALGTSAFAQTHDLLRKSIGGNVELPEPSGADFGLPNDWEDIVVHVDSLIYLGKGVAVKVTGHYRLYSLRAAPMPRPIKVVVDTLYDHPVFSRPHALDSIRRALHAQQVPGLGETKFVGYDSTRAATRPASKGKKRKPVVSVELRDRKDAAVAMLARSDNDPQPPAPAPLFAGGTALFALLLCGGITRLYRQAALPS